jgi:hypothetical protein
MAAGAPTAAQCRGCGRPAVAEAIDLGRQPLGDEFLSAHSPDESPKWPLVVGWCSHCSLLQLIGGDHIEEQPMLAAVSQMVERHARQSATRVVSEMRLPAGSHFVEHHSSHGGEWSGELIRLGMVPLDDAPGAEQVPLIVDVQWLTHQRDLRPALVASTARLADGGRLVIDFHHALALVEHAQVDSFRHGHFVYLGLHALEHALAGVGLTAVDALRTPTFGGGLQVVAVRGGTAEPTPAALGRLESVRTAERDAGLLDLDRLRRLGRQAHASAEALRDHLVEAKAAGRRVLGYGAPSRAALTLSLAGIDADLLPWTADISTAKHGRRLPGTTIGIRSPEELVAAAPDEVLILTWDLAAEVVDQLVEAGLQDADLVTAQPSPTLVGRAPLGRSA